MLAGQQPVVRATGVGKIFDVGPNPVTALEEIDLTIRAGEFVSLIGPSGCGKTTLLRVLGDLIEPTSGEILVNAGGTLTVQFAQSASNLTSSVLVGSTFTVWKVL